MGNWGKRVHFPEDGHATDFSVWRTSVLHSFEDPRPRENWSGRWDLNPRPPRDLGRPGEVLVTSAQIRAARGLLDWTVRDLAERSGVHRDTVSKIETGAYAGAPATLEAIRRTLEYAGVEFTNGDAPGVKLRKR